ncbi:hypothetical protein [Auraticoccus monumenti]|uniref:Uncharacterized protein n=1 Tax=Auraticoccus monumenti TaxID=675864 RepID=A0A1G7BIK0_9ACTN|nr:hypothetical protein [Auraticoccus monumenti]SDE26550.1 hypothetical protein SAMN04489747_2963 [Auraticoccus monumenti]
MNHLRLLPGQPAATNPVLATLGAGVDLAPTGDDRCDHRSGRLRCVRRRHPEHPDAHVRVAGFDEATAEPGDAVLGQGSAA